jgi:hypothetical protein
LLKMPRSQVGLWPKDLKRTLLLKRRAEKCIKLARVQYSFLLVVMAKNEHLFNKGKYLGEETLLVWIHNPKIVRSNRTPSTC